ncbi:alpha-glucosidase C-terminal domain-containing protein [Enterococcus faecium]|nr:alpha-glucosidase C-terminal domain-containing protein [Enterococcus faecium]MDT2334498.1 alpha-glucosidase C-terminal domain-containing protein [Enterococcus faecium]MDT2353929.1 alpha-glucosidase C-terminal domain-containing protein [Enterococcus faecium]
MTQIHYIYQGEEIGMINYPVKSIDEVDDIESQRMYAERIKKGYSKEELIQSINSKGRDNARHPMQWNNHKNGGFTEGTPWLPVGNTEEINVEAALAAQNSLFYTYQKLIELRKELPVIVYGKYQVIETEEPNVLAYLRSLKSQKILVVVNFSDQKTTFPIGKYRVKQVLIQNYKKKITNNLLPYEAFSALIY